MAGALDAGSGGRRHMIAAINVTPLVDVVLVLLIILMVSSTYIVAQSLKVQLPKAKNSDGSAEKPVMVSILKDGSLKLDEQATTEALVLERLKRSAAKDPETNLVVQADKQTHHGRVVQVIDLAKTAGITRFAINVMQAE
jgi:biopolymer transport protein ExbD